MEITLSLKNNFLELVLNPYSSSITKVVINDNGSKDRWMIMYVIKIIDKLTRYSLLNSSSMSTFMLLINPPNRK